MPSWIQNSNFNDGTYYSNVFPFILVLLTPQEHALHPGLQPSTLGIDMLIREVLQLLNLESDRLRDR